MTWTSVNFAFLANHDELMVKTAAQAERYFSNDPPGALTKLRRLGELLAEATAAHIDLAAANKAKKMSQAKLVEALDEAGVLRPELVQLFTDLRQTGNAAVHEDVGTQRDALHHLEMAHKLALWFHKSFGDGPAPRQGRAADRQPQPRHRRVADRVWPGRLRPVSRPDPRGDRRGQARNQGRPRQPRASQALQPGLWL